MAFSDLYMPFRRSSIIKSIYRYLRWFFFNAVSFGAAGKVHYVNIRDIIYGQRPESQFPNKKTIRFLRSGDWDKDTVLIKDHSVYKTLYDRFVNKKSWEDTGRYKEAVAKINKGINFRGATSIEQLPITFKGWDRLFDSIKKNGFKSNRELYLEGKIENSILRLDEITVNISREGRLILNDGWHRFCIAKILNISKIPVRIFVKHSLFVVKGDY